MLGTKGERYLHIELNQDEIETFEENEMTFIYQLMEKMEKDIYQKRGFPQWRINSEEYHDWIELHTPEKPKVIEKIIFQEPQKKGATFLIFSIFLLITLYILFFISL